MRRRWKSLLAYPLLSLLLVAGCEPGGSDGAPGSPTGPRATQSLEDYTLVESSPLALPEQTAALIGGSGGVLSLLGNTLTVPAGAVGESTLFSLTRLPGASIQVDLLATRSSVFGAAIDVGAEGFLGGKAVQVKLTYAGATNVEDPDRLVVLYLRPDGGVEEVPTTVDEAARTVTVELEHFSRYAMAMD